MPHRFTNVKKRDGRIVPFDQSKITNAVAKAMAVTGEAATKDDAEKVSLEVVAALERKLPKTHIPTIEEIQDAVETELILMDYAKTAKAYILYRNERAKVRERKQEVPERVKALAEESRRYFRNPLAEFVYYRSYSNWIPDEGRRETWIETVDRYMAFMKENLGTRLTAAEYAEVREAILKQEAMPSMRLLQFAGKAARTTNVCAYNCSFTAPQRLEDFAEIMYISMCGTGAGFSVESQNVQRLPQIRKQTGARLPTHVIADSKEGWCEALTLGLKAWFGGSDVDFDFSLLRPAGARLKTMGGKSSGPEPLRALLSFARAKILAKQGRRLSNIDVHDICCKIGDIVVAGGVRRSAMISLSDLDDPEMRDAKAGQFYFTEPQRSMANNSAVYVRKPSSTEFLSEWMSLAKSGTGERGIFNRGGMTKQLPKRRLDSLTDDELASIGTNPCGEILLQPKEFCNLSEVVARAEDTEATLLRKIRIATILGTYQSTLTHFPFLSEGWKENCERERLLGVSITGQWDCPAVRNAQVLRTLKARAVAVNAEYAKRFGISSSKAVTCVKPSGTVSQTVDASSGLHPRHAHYYIRRIRISATDALFHMLKDQKVPYFPEVGQSLTSASTYVFEFPVKAPEGGITKDDLSAIDQLEYWKMVKENYTEHNPSVTISVGADEWVAVANWVYENWDMVGGLSFLPREEHAYLLAPYEEITKERYEDIAAKMPQIDFSQILLYEHEDQTDVKKELACVGGVCEIEDLTPASAEAASSAHAGI
ncbi:MAG TPA: ATP cone domain-containing protein [Candidatus Paceibacterota bacterium]|nr:ATP cone domain-containing protein [Candidatus Paceibacterota bacterium]